MGETVNDYCKQYELTVTIQENGLIRDPFGWVVGRCDDAWLSLMTKHATKDIPAMFYDEEKKRVGLRYKGFTYYKESPSNSQELHTI